MSYEYLSVFRSAEKFPRRVVVVVPESRHHEVLVALSHLTNPSQGRSVRRENGKLLTVMSALSDPTEIREDFDLILVGWDSATPADGRGVLTWMKAAKSLRMAVS